MVAQSLPAKSLRPTCTKEVPKVLCPRADPGVEIRRSGARPVDLHSHGNRKRNSMQHV